MASLTYSDSHAKCSDSVSDHFSLSSLEKETITFEDLYDSSLVAFGTSQTDSEFSDKEFPSPSVKVPVPDIGTFTCALDPCHMSHNLFDVLEGEEYCGSSPAQSKCSVPLVVTRRRSIKMQIRKRKLSFSAYESTTGTDGNVLLSHHRLLEMLESPHGPGTFFSMLSPLHTPRIFVPQCPIIDTDPVPDVMRLFGILSPSNDPEIESLLTSLAPQERRDSKLSIYASTPNYYHIHQESHITVTPASKTLSNIMSQLPQCDVQSPNIIPFNGWNMAHGTVPINVPHLSDSIQVTPPPASRAKSRKSSRYQIKPSLSDYLLVQIFHTFCDPLTKSLTLENFARMLQKHSVKEVIFLKQCGKPQYVPSTSTQNLFSALDVHNVGHINLETFMFSLQICNRCTENKRRANVSLGIECGKVDSVLVRVVPQRYEGHKVKSCEHYQWTWCEGYEVTGNHKCKGTNRHDKCPKYLANCTLWKHKLPPKNRKPNACERKDSPFKRSRHFD